MLVDRLRIRDIRNTSTFRLTLLFGLIFAVAVTALLGLIYGLSARELLRRTDRILHMEAAMLAATPPAVLPARIRSEISRSPSDLNYFELRSTDGEAIVGNISEDGRFPLNRPIELPAGPGHDRPLRLLAIRTPSDETLLIARDVSPVVDMRHRVLVILIGSGLAIIVVVLACGAALSLEPLRRVRNLQDALKSIAAGDMRVRMPLSGRGDELDLFAGTVNQMLEELARAIAQVKGVTDAVAHDLRTPLTRVRSQLYRLGQSHAGSAPVRKTIDAATGDLDVVLDRFAALLRISELESGRRRAGFAQIMLRPLLTQVFDLYEPLADDREIAIGFETSGDACIVGDEKLVFEAVSNLLDNAIKFSPPGSSVMLALRNDPAGPVIEVRDHGPGIDAGEQQAVVRRFHRGTNAMHVPGTGLGLSLVLAIVHLHGFALSFEDGKPGLIVRIHCHPVHPTGAVKFISLADAG